MLLSFQTDVQERGQVPARPLWQFADRRQEHALLSQQRIGYDPHLKGTMAKSAVPSSFGKVLSSRFARL